MAIKFTTENLYFLKYNTVFIQNCSILFFQNAVQKRKDCERLVSEHKMEAQQLRELYSRTDVIARALGAEESHFQNEREVHLNQAVKTHLIEQIKFYQNITAKLQDALDSFDA